MAGGWFHRRADRVFKDGATARPSRYRPCPADFRETYIREGWEVEYIYATNWRVICRWIDECGGEELCHARYAYLREHGRHRRNNVRHVGGWTAEKLSALHG
jgi:hypothetical protein